MYESVSWYVYLGANMKTETHKRTQSHQPTRTHTNLGHNPRQEPGPVSTQRKHAPQERVPLTSTTVTVHRGRNRLRRDAERRQPPAGTHTRATEVPMPHAKRHHAAHSAQAREPRHFGNHATADCQGIFQLSAYMLPYRVRGKLRVSPGNHRSEDVG